MEVRISFDCQCKVDGDVAFVHFSEEHSVLPINADCGISPGMNVNFNALIPDPSQGMHFLLKFY
jgi:hypothetical protein